MSPLATSLRFLQTQPDARLVALAREGHEAAFEALIRRYRRRLLSYCRRIVGSDGAAEDVLQQALLQAWVAIGRGTEVTDPRAWLYRIVHNVAISSVRRVSPVLELADADIMSETDHEAEQRIAVRAALAGLAALPALQREVMLSTAVDGRSYDEIATELGLTSGAVRGLLYRARSTLRAAAAALIPTPVVNWAVRHGSGRSSGSSGLYETIAGTGSAGVAGVLLKGGAVIASAGALATAVGISSNHTTLRLKPGSGATAVASADAGVRQGGAGHQQASAGAGGSLIAGRGGVAAASGTGGRGAGSSVGAGGARHAPRILVTLGLIGGHSGPGPSRHDGGGGPNRSGGNGHGDGGSGGGSSGSTGGSGGPGGTSGGGTDGGHDGGGTSGATTPTSGGHDGGGSGGGTISSGGSGGDGSTGTYDSSGDGSGSGSGGDTTTTTTTTTTVTTTSTGSSGGGGD